MLKYLAWYLGGADEDTAGHKNVMFVPLPVGAPAGEVDGRIVFEGAAHVSLETGKAFALPMSVWVGERYEGYPDVPDDPRNFPLEAFLNTDIELTLDGETLIDSDHEDLSQYFFGPADFEEPVVYGAPSDLGAVAAIWAMGLGMVHHPLTPGEHTLHLWSDNPAFPWIYDNTWYITVE